MLKAIEKIFEATACSHEDFMISLLRQDAVAYNFLILGEAAGRMSPEVYRIHPEIPWKLMTGMRNVLIMIMFRPIINWYGLRPSGTCRFYMTS